MLTIIDYDGGNLRSVLRACGAVGLRSQVTQDAAAVRAAERIIFPGVGHAQAAMETLNRTGLADALRDAVAGGIPVLGICVGCQIVLDTSEESSIPALGLLPGKTKRFDASAASIKVPHIGWNEVTPTRPHPLLEGMQKGDEFYFVHSYYPSPTRESDVYATTEYGTTFCCALGRGNLFATQFHPEKSGRFGLELLERFSTWDGTAPTCDSAAPGG